MMAMRVALGQMDGVAGEVGANVAAMVEWVGEAAERGCDVVWFPELADTGYVLGQMSEVAGTWPGEAHDALAAAAQRHRIAVGAGLSERVGGARGEAVYNSLAVFDRQGQRVGHYRKAHLFAAGQVNEAGCFKAGATEAHDGCIDLDGLLHGLSICYDLRFAELYRQRADPGAGQSATVLVNVTAWPAVRTEHWDVLTRARAIENQAYFVGVGRVGEDEGITFAGRSRVVAPTGEVLIEGSATRPELLVAEIDPAAVSDFRSAVPALAARRRDLFG